MNIVQLRESDNPLKQNGFVSKILIIAGKDHTLMYNQKKSLCVFPCILEYLDDIIAVFTSSFPSKTVLWTFLPLDENLAENIRKIAEFSFDYPYITNMCPTGKNIDTGLAFARTIYKKHERKNTEHDVISTFSPLQQQEFVLHKCLYILEEYEKDDLSCSLYAQISKSTVEFLRAASEHGVYKRKTSVDPKIEGLSHDPKNAGLSHDPKNVGLSHDKTNDDAHKEVTGELCVTKIRKGEKMGTFVYVIGLKEKSVEIGNHEDVDVSQTRYNFHTHPKSAYIKHSVEKAWPSLTDYLGFLKLGNNTIFHCVAALEGLYVLSFSAYWGNHLKNVDKEFIKRNYKLNHRLPYTPEEYANMMNKLYPKKEIQHPIFEVQFFRWENASNVFRVYYSRNGKTCISTEEDLNMHTQLHEKFSKKQG